MSNPWDKQPGETPKAFAAFSAYLAMEPKKRSVLAAYLSTLEGAEKGRNRPIKTVPMSTLEQSGKPAENRRTKNPPMSTSEERKTARNSAIKNSPMSTLGESEKVRKGQIKRPPMSTSEGAEKGRKGLIKAPPMSTLQEPEKARKGPINSVPSSWKDWAFDHDWKSRAAAYDIYNDRKRRMGMERVHSQEVQRYRAQLRKDCEALGKVARIALAKAAEALQQLDMEGARPHTVATMLTAATSALKIAPLWESGPKTRRKRKSEKKRFFFRVFNCYYCKKARTE